MPFVLLLVGVLCLIVAVKGTQGTLYDLLKAEFTGTNNFVVWAAAIMVLGLLGYIKPIRPVTHAFIALIVLVMILANGSGVFSKLGTAFAHPNAPKGTTTGSGDTSSTGSSGSGSTGKLTGLNTDTGFDSTSSWGTGGGGFDGTSGSLGLSGSGWGGQTQGSGSGVNRSTYIEVGGTNN